MLYYLVATLCVLACFLLLLVVLLQQGKGRYRERFRRRRQPDGVRRARRATVLTRATAVLGALFMRSARSCLRCSAGRDRISVARHRGAAAAGSGARRQPAEQSCSARANASAAADRASDGSACPRAGEAGCRGDAAEASRERSKAPGRRRRHRFRRTPPRRESSLVDRFSPAKLCSRTPPVIHAMTDPT